MDREQHTDKFTAIEDQFAGYTVYDRTGDKIGKVDDLFLDEDDRPEYVGVKMGFLGLRSTLIPMEIVTVDESSQSLTVSQEKGAVKDAPTFDDDDEITPEFEEQVHSYYGLTRQGGYSERGFYGTYYSDESTTASATTTGTTATGGEESGHVGPGIYEGDIETGEFRGHPEEDEGLRQSTGSDLEDVDELRVQRSEEELVAGTREREAGRVGVRKRVRTDRERISVPKRREEVHVDRVPVEGREASEAEIGEDEVVMPVTEEEVVVSKRPVVKEEVRIRTDVVEEEEIVEEDVRKEEVEVIDETERGRGRGTTGLDDDTSTGGRNL
jgi:uncharacterized protein (TIGR02271 family)